MAKERATNEALQFRDVQEFVLVSASVSTPRPPTTERVVALNRCPWVAWPGGPQELQDADDATVLDVRPFHDYSAGHIPGAISVSVDGGSFGTKSGFVLMPDERIVLHARSEAEALDAAQKLWAVGILDLAGYVIAPDAPKTLPTLDVDELRELLESPGHSPDSLSFLVRENSRPLAIFTGDLLFVNDVGRPDLRDADDHWRSPAACGFALLSASLCS